MSSAGRAVSSNGCVTKPKGRETGLRGCFVQIRSSLLTGSYVMETAEQREPYESRGSRTVLGEPGGESPPGHSTVRDDPACRQRRQLSSEAAIAAPSTQRLASTLLNLPIHAHNAFETPASSTMCRSGLK